MWRLGITAASLRNGNVLLYVRAPGAGTLGARASAPFRVRATLSRHRGKARVRGLRTVVRTLANAGLHAGAGEEGPLALTLPLGAAYRSLAERAGGAHSHRARDVQRARPPDAASANSGHVPPRPVRRIRPAVTRVHRASSGARR